MRAVALLACLLISASTAMATDHRPQINAGQPATGEKQTLVLVVTKWNDNCDATNRTGWDGMLDAWYDEITDTRDSPSGHGTKAWDEDGFYKNDDIVDSRFTDQSLVEYGDDAQNDNVDDVDAVMIGLHGSHNFDGQGAPWRGAVRTDEAGSGDCLANQNNMELGEHDVEFVHLSSCHSMCDWDENFDNWETSFAGVHQVNGFYGLMFISWTYSSRYSGFADDAFDIAITDAWVDQQYSNGFWTGGDDHCPVSMVAGTSTSNASTRASNEEYDYVYDDVSGTNFFEFISVGGCDPSGHNP